MQSVKANTRYSVIMCVTVRGGSGYEQEQKILAVECMLKLVLPKGVPQHSSTMYYACCYPVKFCILINVFQNFLMGIF
jgi:hypothetical protein